MKIYKFKLIDMIQYNTVAKMFNLNNEINFTNS